MLNRACLGVPISCRNIEFLVGEAEVKSSTTLQLGVLYVILPFALRHRIPDPVATLVLPNIVRLGQEEESNTGYVNADQYAVSSPVLWLVIVEVDKVGHDIAQLHTHLEKKFS